MHLGEWTCIVFDGGRYQKPGEARMTRRTGAILIAAIAAIGVLYVLHATFWWSVDRRGYCCAVCGAAKWRKTLSVFGITVSDVWSDPQRTSLTDIYDECIGDPHNHKWAGGGWSATVGGLANGPIYKDEVHSVPPFPFWQPRLTGTALRAVEQVRDWPAADRKQLYQSVFACGTRESGDEVVEIEKKAEAGGASIIWRQWLNTRVSGEDSTVETDQSDEEAL
jgi:hypothetical protein